LGELAVGVGDLSAQCFVALGATGDVGMVEGGHGDGEVFGVESRGEPRIQGGEDVVLADVDGGRVVQGFGSGVLGRIAAAVGRAAVVPVALHPSSAVAAVDQAAQHVGAPVADGRPALGGWDLGPLRVLPLRFLPADSC
jgi:hypothetical protein